MGITACKAYELIACLGSAELQLQHKRWDKWRYSRVSTSLQSSWGIYSHLLQEFSVSPCIYMRVYKCVCILRESFISNPLLSLLYIFSPLLHFPYCKVSPLVMSVSATSSSYLSTLQTKVIFKGPERQLDCKTTLQNLTVFEISLLWCAQMEGDQELCNNNKKKPCGTKWQKIIQQAYIMTTIERY